MIRDAVILDLIDTVQAVEKARKLDQQPTSGSDDASDRATSSERNSKEMEKEKARKSVAALFEYAMTLHKIAYPFTHEGMRELANEMFFDLLGTLSQKESSVYLCTVCDYFGGYLASVRA